MKKAKKLTALLCAFLATASLSAAALTLETVENAAETQTETMAPSSSLSADIDIPLEDETYGKLVYYNNFENGSTTASLVSVEGRNVTASAENASLALAANPSGTGNALKLTATGAHSCMVLNPKFVKSGDYTVVVDLFFPEGSTAGIRSRWEYKDTFGQKTSDGWNWDTKATTNGTWHTYTFTVTADGTDKKAGLANISPRAVGGANTVYYYDNYRLYFNPVIDDDEVRLVEKDTKTKIKVEGDTYTFPQPADTKNFVAWRNEVTGKAYKAGVAFPASEVIGASYAAFYDIGTDYYDRTYGELIYYADFENDMTTTPAYTSALYPVTAAGTAVSMQTTANPTDANTKALELTSTDAHSALQLKPQFDGAGTYTLMVDLYFSEGTPDPGVLGRMQYSNGGKDLWTDWKAFCTKTGEWQTYTWTITASGETGQLGLQEIAARRWANNTTPYYYDNLRLYYEPALPDTKIGLIDKGFSARSVVTGTTYTFPTPYEAEGFLAWRDALTGKVYKPGTTVPASEVVGSTYEAFYDIGIDIVDETYGELIYYADFENGTSTTPAYSNARYPVKAAGTSVSMETTANPTDAATKALKLTSTGDYSALQLHPQFEGAGTYTIMVDLYFTEGTPVPGVLGRIEYTNGGGAPWQDPWKAYCNKTGEWQTYIYTVTASGATGRTGLKDIAARRYSNNTTPYYYDNLRLYYNPKVADTDIRLVDGGFSRMFTVTGETFTFPAPMDTTDFIGWYSKDTTTTYKSGEAASVADVVGKTFYTFHQTADAPAMGFSYEGEYDAWKDGTLITYATKKYDHISAWNLVMKPGWTGGESGTWKSDDRIFITHKYTPEVTPFDPKEYSLVSYRYKVNNAIKAPNVNPVPEDQITALTNPKFVMDYFAIDEYHGFYTPGGEHFMCGTQTVPSLGEFHIFNADMSIAANSIAACPWSSLDKIYGFSLQMTDANYGFDLDIDYLRVYRHGITTITYDTNKPTDAATSDIKHEVPADTKRGIGTGYLLTGEEPVIDGFTFVGWATSANATAADVVETIDLTGNTTVYAVWAQNDYIVPTTIEKSSLRTKDVTGLRFAATVWSDIKYGTGALTETLNGVQPDAYGFIVSRESLLKGTDLNFGGGADENGRGTTKSGVAYVTGVAFDKAKGIDRVYDNDGTYFSEVEEGVSEAFTAVLLNIPSTHYTEKMVARPYLVINGRTFYGQARAVSMQEVALAMYEHFDSLTEEEKTVVTKILTATGDLPA